MLTATLSHHFSAGHRICGLTGPGAKCLNVHGHTFGVEWTVELPGKDAGVVEFAALKQVYRGWVDRYLDHGFLVHVEDTDMVEMLESIGSKHFPMSSPPTTEAIAELIAAHSIANAPGITLLSVRVSEGPHNAATWVST